MKYETRFQVPYQKLESLSVKVSIPAKVLISKQDDNNSFKGTLGQLFMSFLLSLSFHAIYHLTEKVWLFKPKENNPNKCAFCAHFERKRPLNCVG